ncbi:MAG TPA: ATPase, partial [Bacteroidia bacterium]|nr:ATPase [Bacteroidia bacterium]
MNFLIADSGSTKTDWRYVSGTENISVHTQGYNPYHVTKDKMEESLRADILPRLEGKQADQLFFYGSGCNEKMSPQVKESLRKFFPDADVEVHSDMLGAARGLCGNEKG